MRGRLEDDPTYGDLLFPTQEAEVVSPLPNYYGYVLPRTQDADRGGLADSSIQHDCMGR